MDRGLTANELACAAEVFQDSLDYHAVKIHRRKYVFFQPAQVLMTPNGEIYAPDLVYQDDYTLYGLNWSEIFIHELTHVWQYQNRVLNPRFAGMLEFVKNRFDYHKAYSYVLASGRDLIEYGMEQQAAMIADYFLVIKSGDDFGRHNANAETFEQKKELLIEVTSRFAADPKYARR